jgi:NAD(P)-dependent dehydrogenase (short-subunit alcohol dehydrogenase family)
MNDRPTNDRPMKEAPATGGIRIDGKVVLITGTSPNIGASLARGFAAAGGRVACCDVVPDHAQGAAASIGDDARALGLVCDVTEPESVQRAVDAVVVRWGRIDVLVNNAVRFDVRGVLDMPLDAYRSQLDVILIGAFNMTKAVSRSMIDQQVRGSIINILSTAAWQGQAGNVGYCTGKSGLINFTRSVAMELAPYGIRVNGFTPTATRPEHPELSAGFDTFAAAAASAGTMDFVGANPWERLPEPSDYVGSVLFLASEASAMMTGSFITVDGGALAKYWPQSPARHHQPAQPPHSGASPGN